VTENSLFFKTVFAKWRKFATKNEKKSLERCLPTYLFSPISPTQQVPELTWLAQLDPALITSLITQQKA
jgi:hypothetical protein